MIAGLLERARKFAQTVMIDEVTISRFERGDFDPDTGGYTLSETVIYVGECRLRSTFPSSVTSSDIDSADVKNTTHRHALLVPYGKAANAKPGDIATVAGRGVYTVAATLASTTKTADALAVEEVEAQ